MPPSAKSAAIVGGAVAAAAVGSAALYLWRLWRRSRGEPEPPPLAIVVMRGATRVCYFVVRTKRFFGWGNAEFAARSLSPEYEALMVLLSAGSAADTRKLPDVPLAEMRAGVELFRYLFPPAPSLIAADLEFTPSVGVPGATDATRHRLPGSPLRYLDVSRAPLPSGGRPEFIRARTKMCGRWLTPRAGTRIGSVRPPVVLHLHGGGGIAGSSRTHEGVAGAFLRELTGAEALLLDYRQPPEYPYPSAVADAVAAYVFLVLDRGVDPRRVVLSGDSAGAHLAALAALAIRDIRRDQIARDGGATIGGASGGALPMPAALLLLNGAYDMTMSADSYSRNARRDPLSSPAALLDDAGRMQDWYFRLLTDCDPDADPRDPALSPLNADWAGMPPTLLAVGEFEVIVDDNRRLHEKCQAAGVDSTLLEARGMCHLWWANRGSFPEADAGAKSIAGFVREKLAAAAAAAAATAAAAPPAAAR